MNTYHLSKIRIKPGAVWKPESKQEIMYCLLRMADMLDHALKTETGLTEDARELFSKFAEVTE